MTALWWRWNEKTQQLGSIVPLAVVRVDLANVADVACQT